MVILVEGQLGDEVVLGNEPFWAATLREVQMNIDKLTVGAVFSYHRPFGTQPERYETLRAKARELATLILDSCPPSREASLALTKLQEVVMWANASIAVNEVDPNAPAGVKPL